MPRTPSLSPRDGVSLFGGQRLAAQEDKAASNILSARQLQFLLQLPQPVLCGLVRDALYDHPVHEGFLRRYHALQFFNLMVRLGLI